MRKKLLFVFNPRSGKGRIKNSLFELTDLFTGVGYDVTVHPTQDAEDCSKTVVRLAGEYDVLAVSGGDGTLNEAVAGMLELPEEQRVPIGYIPSGTMNDFANGNGIPKDIVSAAKTLIGGSIRKYDIGRFNDRKFIYVAGFGAFTDVSYITPQTSKNFFGPAAYFVEGIKSLSKIEGTDVRIKTEEGRVIEEEALICLIMNSTSVAGLGFGEFYSVDTGDGLFEIMVIPKSSKLTDLAAVISEIMNGERDSGGVHVISTKGAFIETEKPVRWTIDGEFGGETDRVSFGVLHDAVEFIVKKEE